jgi:flagellar hook-basal body complex protein FliE
MNNVISGSSLGSLSGIGELPKLTPAQNDDNGGFGAVLKNALSQVDQLSTSADQQVNTLVTGGDADVSNVMVAVEKADISFQLMMQVRNKIVSAYQDIEKMQF